LLRSFRRWAGANADLRSNLDVRDGAKGISSLHRNSACPEAHTHFEVFCSVLAKSQAFLHQRGATSEVASTPPEIPLSRTRTRKVPHSAEAHRATPPFLFSARSADNLQISIEPWLH
jgi:hypothetical protein